ncbi:hypothetical_protein (plasmid) [Leishmania braziliensis MHOM/BR/75/M2904]|uniref:Hypothetical_protein n=1 Tax=Leishmania braziliensis MHOM/BR/75/M2904 TaxID=420245 RepID=A0A3P3Z8H5_LEIBR|nr:hypothetical_protein [Leishmania braziliensis MHOM/BR/75/M2904]
MTVPTPAAAAAGAFETPRLPGSPLLAPPPPQRRAVRSAYPAPPARLPSLTPLGVSAPTSLNGSPLAQWLLMPPGCFQGRPTAVYAPLMLQVQPPARDSLAPMQRAPLSLLPALSSSHEAADQNRAMYVGMSPDL